MTETYDWEKENRTNALRQLLGNTQADVIRAFEGRMSTAEYEALRMTRQAWKNELSELLGEPTEQEGPGLTPDVILAAMNNNAAMTTIQKQVREQDTALVELADIITGGVL